MPKGLARYQEYKSSHFITFSCYRRRPFLADSNGYNTFEHELETIRAKYEFTIAGYVLMPEHVHLLVGEPRNISLARALQLLKQNTSRKLNRTEDKFWQRRYYDFNVWSEEKRQEKLSYMHRNPVRRGLAELLGDWPWSSFLHHATGVIGTVGIESRWTARLREKQLAEVP